MYEHRYDINIVMYILGTLQSIVQFNSEYGHHYMSQSTVHIHILSDNEYYIDLELPIDIHSVLL